jgi:hypothetical protein
VIQQFLGYRLVKRGTELKRLRQLRQLAADGLIHTSRDGRFSVFISDDLHPPPLRAVKYRDERLERLKGWKGHTDGMYMIAQARGETGQDPELAGAILEAGIQMLYIGVESDNAENLKLVKKRQDPGQMHKDLSALNQQGFTIVAMTIIGLPYDTEEGIMRMADWVTGISKYQTANLLTPLPATSNWSGLVPLDADGKELAEGQLRPYHLYTGRQLVYKDERWSMQESRELFDRYHAKLSPVDKLYERVFRLMRSPRFQTSTAGKELNGTISARINEFSEVLRTLSDSSKELPEALASRMHEMSVALGKYRTQLAATGKEVPEVIAARVNEASEALKKYKQQISITGREISETVALRINEVNETLMSLSDLSMKPVQSRE